LILELYDTIDVDGSDGSLVGAMLNTLYSIFPKRPAEYKKFAAKNLTGCCLVWIDFAQ